MTHFNSLKEAFKDRPILLVDSSTNEVLLLARDEATRRIDATGLFSSAAMMNVERALVNFATIVGRKDRTFTLNEIAAITGTPYSKANHWVTEGVVTPSVRAGDGPGKSKERLFSWRDAFMAGVCGSLRRQSIPLDLIRAVGCTLAKVSEEAIA